MAKLDTVIINRDLGEKENEGKKEPSTPKVSMQPYKPKISFPQRLKNNVNDPQFVKFLELLK